MWYKSCGAQRSQDLLEEGKMEKSDQTTDGKHCPECGVELSFLQTVKIICSSPLKPSECHQCGKSLEFESLTKVTTYSIIIGLWFLIIYPAVKSLDYEFNIATKLAIMTIYFVICVMAAALYVRSRQGLIK